MSQDSLQEAKAYKELLSGKVQALLDEFALGKISREQFHTLYERYNSRLAIVDHALFSGNPEAIAIAQGGPSTVQIREQTEGKALGAAIYHTYGQSIIETLGNFPLRSEAILPTLQAMSQMRPGDQQIEHIAEHQWLVFIVGSFTIVVVLFRNEPSKLQIRDMERLHHDFEDANRVLLKNNIIRAGTLAYPFIALIQQKLKPAG